MGCESYINEIKGISKALQLDSICNVLLSHLLYEFTCACTSIVIETNNENSKNDDKNKDKTNFIMGRTLDWLDFGCLRKLTIDINVYKCNKLLYRFTTFAGYIGALTGISYQSKFGFAVNFRKESSRTSSSSSQELPKPNLPVGLLGRYILDHSVSYSDAVNYCRNVTLMAPTYFIIVSETKACQITRNEARDVNPIFININTDCKHSEDEDDIKYLIQTNIDHWKYLKKNRKMCNVKEKKKKLGLEKDVEGEIEDEMESIPRICLCQKYIFDKKCQTKKDLVRLLNTFPVYEQQCTVHTTVIDVANLNYKTVRFCYIQRSEHV